MFRKWKIRSCMMDTRRSKVVVRYDELLNNEFAPHILELDELFLLRPNPEYLYGRIKESDEAALQGRSGAFAALFDKAASTIAGETSVAVYNASLTVTTALEGIIPKLGFSRTAETMFDDAEKCLTAILRRYYFFAVENVAPDLKAVAMYFLEKLCALPCPESDLALFSSCILVPAFDVLCVFFAQADDFPTLGRRALRIFASMLARVHMAPPKDQALLGKFATFHDDDGLHGLSQLLLEELEMANEHASQCLANANGSVLSKISNMFSGYEESDLPYDSSMDLPTLFILFESVKHNKAFVSSMVMTRSSLEASDSEKECSLLLRYFLTRCSLAFDDSKNDAGMFCGRVSLFVLTLLTDDVFVQNALHDPHNTSIVPIFQPKMLHRPAQLDCQRGSATLGTTTLDLITELLVSHLKIGFPLEYFELALGVVHRILSYQKNRCIRMKQWQPLFSALLSLMRFLMANEAKCTTSIYPLCYRIILVINLFLTFGDTFLPSGEAYDLLYYELVRQEFTFTTLRTTVERRLQKPKDADWEFASKVKNHLVNPMIIINTVNEKISAVGGNLEQEQIMDLIRVAFETLSLKLYDGLTVPTPFDQDKHTPFLQLLGKTVHSDFIKRSSSEPNPFDYNQLVENLSSIEY